MMVKENEVFENEKTKERRSLLEKCFGYTPSEANEIIKRAISDNDFLEVFKAARSHFRDVLKRPMTSESFYGKSYTVKKGELLVEGCWGEIKQNLLNCLYGVQGKNIMEILQFILDKGGWVDFTTLKARFEKFRNPLDILVGYDILQKKEIAGSMQYGFPEETIPLIREVLNTLEIEEGGLIAFESDIARNEYNKIKIMDEEFENSLNEILENKLDSVIQFGKELNVSYIAEYFRRMFGDILFFDSLLSITQQYSLADVAVVNPEGQIAMHTGFNIAFFGAPGTGKTFAINDIIRGNRRKGVKAHGLLGRNRYCGGITPARFIRMGEAYQDRRFNFVIPEFNDWFKYKGMVEPLKLALEQGEITYETKHETIGPYNFGSFFSTNYNTKILEYGYKITVADPNFSAIEDRMLCRLHKMTEQRYRDLARSQKMLALGKINMDKADKIKKHLILIYAIETQHKALRDKFPLKNVLLTSEVYKKLDDAKESILVALRELKSKVVPFSPRLERRTIQLACAMSLISYFNIDAEHITIGKNALDYAIRFFIEEAVIRSQEKIDQKKVLEKLGIE